MGKFGYIGANTAPTQTETANKGVFDIAEHANQAGPNDGTWAAGGKMVEYLVVGGGGSGSQGGGSGGGVRSGTFSAKTGVAYTVTVGGAGGTSSIVGADSRTIESCTAGGNGGAAGFNGGGGNHNGNNRGLQKVATETDGKYGSMGSGLSGGGGSSTAAIGNNGSNRIAGSGAAGTDAYSQWATDTSSGHSSRYGGGGGANSNNYEQQHFAGGGTGGGGNGGQNGLNNNNGSSGTANTGGGGGGGNSGGTGGSGIVIVRLTDTDALSTTGSPSTYTANGYDYYKFTASGSFTI